MEQKEARVSIKEISVPGMMAHAYTLSIQKAEAGELALIQAQLWLQDETVFQKTNKQEK